MGFSQKLITFLFTLLFIPAIAATAAETLYVTDQLIVTLRRGKSNSHKILSTLKTGTPLEVLEKNEGDEYVKVKAQDGLEGYVLAQYLTDKTPKTIVITRLEKKIAQVKEQLAQSKAKNEETTQKLKALHTIQEDKENEQTTKLNELRQGLTKVKEELQIVTAKYNTLVENSGKVLEITDENNRLQKENVKLSAEAQLLTDENTSFKRNRAVSWFLAGAGVLFFGWIIGKMSRKKRPGLY